MDKQFNPGKEVVFVKGSQVFEHGTNVSYKVKEGTRGVVTADCDSGEVGECSVQVEKEGGEKVIVVTNDNNLKLSE